MRGAADILFEPSARFGKLTRAAVIAPRSWLLF
jgi:hypothetical protein